MAASVLVDASFLVTLLNIREFNHAWAEDQATRLPPPWKTCEPVLSEAFHLLGRYGATSVASLLTRKALIPAFHLDHDVDAVIKLMEKYGDVPMSLADACLVRMSEILPDPVVLTTDADFRIYRRHGRQVIPCVLP
jgi:predicted nucleic acid-binding protein